MHRVDATQQEGAMDMPKVKITVIGLALAIVLSSAPTANAQSTIKACVSNSDGTLRIVPSSTTSCRKNESLLRFLNGAPQPRFVDNGDGTITDNQTGLMWEQKLAADDPACPLFDIPQSPRSPHCVQNTYQWSSSGAAADGDLFTSFLARINTELGSSSTGEFIRDVCFAGHCDWRIPNLLELQTIVGPCSGTQITCIDPIFGPIIGSNLGGGGSGSTPPYWSSTTLNDGSFDFTSAWAVSFVGRGFGADAKSRLFFVRAVRSAR
jgi:hypothetical protein